MLVLGVAVADTFEAKVQSFTPVDICVFLTVLATTILFVKTTNRSRISQARSGGSRMPGPKPFPILGNLPQLGEKCFDVMTKWWKEYGDIYMIKMGSRDTVVLNGLSAIRECMVKKAAIFAGRPDFCSFQICGNGNSVAFADYDERWRMQHKITSRALSMFINDSEHPIDEYIAKEAANLAEELLQSKDQACNPYSKIQLAVNGIVYRICFGIHPKKDREEHQRKVTQCFQSIMETHNVVRTVNVMPWTKGLLSKPVHRLEELCATFTELMAEKAREHTVDYDPNVIRDALDAYVKAGDEISEEDTKTLGLTKEQLLCTIQDIIAAGTESPTHVMLWSLLYMAKFPDVQEAVYAEIERELGPGQPLPRQCHRDLLPYTEATLMEIMRHASPSPLSLPHATTQDTEINGHFVPKGTMVFANQHSVSQDETVWDNPQEFRPERFLTEEGKIDKSKVENVIIFGVGKRRCLGEQLARIQMFLFFTTLLQRCRFSQIKGKKLTFDGNFLLTHQPKPYKIIIERR